jgi:hypothetical protein
MRWNKRLKAVSDPSLMGFEAVCEVLGSGGGIEQYFTFVAI